MSFGRKYHRNRIVGHRTGAVDGLLCSSYGWFGAECKRVGCQGGMMYSVYGKLLYLRIVKR